MPASAAVRARKSARAKPRSKRERGGWTSLWPLALGIAVTPFAMRAASILALEGPKAFALLYPWVMVLRSPALHLSSGVTETLSQGAMMLQFPFYGLLMTLTYRAGQHLRACIIGLAAHFLGLLAVVALAWLAS